MYVTRTYRNRLAGQPGPGLDMLLAPASCLMVMLILTIYSGVRDPAYEYCPCGVKKGRSTVPRLVGPDPLVRAPVIEIEPDEVTLDGTVVFSASDAQKDDPLVIHSAAASRLRHELERKKAAWMRYYSGERFEGRVLLKANRDTPVNVLLPYLIGARAAGYHRVLLYLRAFDTTGLFAWSRYSGAEAITVPEASEGRACTTVHVPFFDTYDELARAVVVSRRAGDQVHLSLLVEEAGIRRPRPILWRTDIRVSPFRIGEPDPDEISRTRVRRCRR